MRSFAGARLIAFVCECADDDCRRTVALTPEAYGILRDDGEAVLLAGHTVESSSPVSS